MRKILFIVGSLPPMECGVGYYTASLLEQLAAQEENLTVLSAAQRGTLDKRVELLSAPGWRLRNLPALIRRCKQAQADIIHVQYPAAGYGRQLGINVLPWLLRLFVRRSRLVITLHEYFSSPFLGRSRDFITIVPAQTIILSNEADRHALPFFLRKKANIIPIGSSIETDRPDDAAAATLLGDKSGEDTVLFFGFVFPAKQLDLLVSAMKDLPSKQLLVASDLDQRDAYHERVQAQINDHNQAVGHQQIKVTGFQPQAVLAALLQKVSCFVLPQNAPLNTKSSTAVTALRYDLPIIGKLGKAWENSPFVNDQNALLLDTVTPQSIAQAVTRLDNPELRTTLKKNAAQVGESYSWSAITALHEALYEEIVR